MPSQVRLADTLVDQINEQPEIKNLGLALVTAVTILVAEALQARRLAAAQRATSLSVGSSRHNDRSRRE